MSDRPSVIEMAAIGLAAGLAGTIIMTLGQSAEMKMRGRKPSRTPAQAVEKVSGIDLATRRDEEKAANIVHFAYGTGLGLGLAALDRVKQPWRSALFGAGAWALGMTMLRQLRLTSPLAKQEPADLAADIAHHAVYAAAAGAAYPAMRGRE